MSLGWFNRRNAVFFAVLCVIPGVFVAGCEQEPGPAGAASSEIADVAATQPAGSPQTTAELWSRSCALCHVDGNASAPRIGNVEEWRPRLQKGRDVLLAHTLEGFGQMPPLGYCMACERDDFVALIDFMTTGIEGELAGPDSSEPRS